MMKFPFEFWPNKTCYVSTRYHYYKAIALTNVVPWKVPRKSGNFVSKNLLWIYIVIPEITIAPTILVSNVFIPAIVVSPLTPPTFCVKSTPKLGPQNVKIALIK